MCLMAVFAASVRALVTRLVMNTSMAGHQVFRVSQSRSVWGVSAAFTQPAEAGLGLAGGVEGRGLQDESEAFFDAPGG